MTENIETDSAVCALIYKAIRDTETKSSKVNYITVQNMLNLYRQSCEGVKDISSLVVDINSAIDVLGQFKNSDYTIEEVKKITKDSIDPSSVKLVEDQLKNERTF